MKHNFLEPNGGGGGSSGREISVVQRSMSVDSAQTSKGYLVTNLGEQKSGNSGGKYRTTQRNAYWV